MTLISRMPDYSTYSIRELYGVLNTIDREEFPDRHAIAQSEFQRKGEQQLLTTGINWYDALPTGQRADFPARVAGWIMLVGGLLISLALLAAGARGTRPLMIVGACLALRPIMGLLLILKRRRMAMAGLIVELVMVVGSIAAVPIVTKAAAGNSGPAPLLMVGTVLGVLSLLFLTVSYVRALRLERFEQKQLVLTGGN